MTVLSTTDSGQRVGRTTVLYSGKTIRQIDSTTYFESRQSSLLTNRYECRKGRVGDSRIVPLMSAAPSLILEVAGLSVQLDFNLHITKRSNDDCLEMCLH
jgi:hypothetical protein